MSARAGGDPVVETAEGPVLVVRARPRSRADEVLGVAGGALRVAVRAAPERGRANDAVLRTIAGWLGIPARDVELASGGSARDKRVRVRGLTAADLRKRCNGME